MGSGNNCCEYQKDWRVCLIDFDFNVHPMWIIFCDWVCRDCERDFLHSVLVDRGGFGLFRSGYDC